MRGDAHVLVAQNPREPGGEVGAEAGGQGRARSVVQVGQTFQPGAAQGLLLLVRQLKGGDRQAAGGVAVLTRFEQAAGTEAGQGAGNLGRSGQSTAALEPSASGAGLDRLHQARLAAEQVGAAGHVQHQAMRGIQGDHGGEAAEILQHLRQQGVVGVGAVGDDAQGRGSRSRIGQGQAGGQPRPRRRRIDGGQPQGALDLFDQNDWRRVLRRRVLFLSPLLAPQPVAGQPGEPDRQIAAWEGGMISAHDPTP
ncbi:hypothetical protein D3C86_1131110 [compost metagenome]